MPNILDGRAGYVKAFVESKRTNILDWNDILIWRNEKSVKVILDNFTKDILSIMILQPLVSKDSERKGIKKGQEK